MPDPTDPAALAEALRAPLLQISRRLRQEAQRVGMSALDALILGHIRKKPGVGASELASAERMSRPSMSGHIKRLEAAGWIVRADDEADGRRSGFQITAAGEDQLAAIRQSRNDWLAARLARLDQGSRADLAAAQAAFLKLLSLDP
ncbi:MarR family winged helix-turn-helix transcriptional regulator [Phenylobacterium sp.]|jgi:DNA-binding MarR family transcriptional regulator|uniref:MarR family winged helix-turn-helix transcriptional regulator n=1 Tax=Phenylobacterium sp. TaxID=1871053 RepID=UPI0035B2AC49